MGFVSSEEEIERYVVSSEVAEKLEQLARLDSFMKETDLFRNGALVSKMSEQIRIRWISKRLLTNSPTRWELVLWAEQLPFTWNRHEFENGNVVRESPCINTASAEDIRNINPENIDLHAAQAVVDYRDRVGEITGKDDLKKIN